MSSRRHDDSDEDRVADDLARTRQQGVVVGVDASDDVRVSIFGLDADDAIELLKQTIDNIRALNADKVKDKRVWS